ncbi:RNA-directed DNA polymerase (reverse transcriptase)-related family protein [Rhynchospora pubera]|uniref:RNA-directed DNA polymerase (Reverse transcriptase)-related family protein n=1 Tax=Rhynchospora pubera TaxID=906938 RepID=A0AAV8E418_9POAL|nr:RNA-directed DNA polymerase (reverse transcriptase)-related family protein [Rhynchospora pubera]
MLKADINKAFDKLDWNFLERAMRYINIPDKIITMMLSSYKRAKVTININGHSDGFLQPTQGLRRGCPMSPYMFIIAMEVLSIWLQQTCTQGLLKGVRLAHTSPVITHAIYADDLILMGDASRAEVDTLVNIMHKFGYVSGLYINPTKSRLWFSKRCEDVAIQRVQDAWRATRVQGDEKYLGINLSPNGDAKRIGALLLEKMQQKLSGWKSNMLSHAGRLVLIKSILMTMPVYCMSVEMLPKEIIKKINSLMAKFFWGKTNQNRYLALIAWKNICKPVSMGGLGVKDLQNFGDALFLKMVWSIMADEDKPWVKICKAKYFPNVGYLRARNATGGSKMWRQILSKRDFFSENVMWHVGNGEKACALSQPRFQGWTVCEEATKHDRSLKIKDLVDSQTGQWNEQKLNLLYQPMQVQQILQGSNKPVLDGEIGDKLIWQQAQNGKYTVKQGYKQIMQVHENSGHEQHDLWEGIWKKKNITPRVKIFVWRLINKGLPMGVHMHSRFPNFPSICQRCYEENEYDMHCLFFCNTSRQVWFASSLGIRVHELPMDIKSTLQQITHRLEDQGVQLFVNTVWEIWKERNKAVIEHRIFKPLEVLQRVSILQALIAINQGSERGVQSNLYYL